MKNFGQLRTVTVWLVLLGFLCGMMGPSVVMAKVHRDIDMEGDPGDGDEYSGGTGGSFPDGDNVNSRLPLFEGDLYIVNVVSTFVNGKVVFHIELSNMERKK